jgi:hypothetical protein
VPLTMARPSRPAIHARKQRDFLMNSLRSVLLAASVLDAATCSDSLGLASAASYPNSLTMTCAQVQDHIRKHGQTLLATGQESGTTASIMPIAAVPFPGTPAPGTWLIAMSDGGATTILQLK